MSPNTKKSEKENKPQKPRVLMIAFGGCNGCHVTVLDMHEELLDVLPHIEFVRASVIADMNRKDIPESDVALVEGSICNDENLKLIKEVRKRTKTLIALGSCSAFGGVPGLRNLYDLNDCIDEGYVSNLSTVNPDKVVPHDYDVIPKQLNYVRNVGSIVKVDFIIPGCPPVPSMIKNVLLDLLGGKEPTLPTKNLCYECHRKHKKIISGDRKIITWNIDTIIESDLDPDVCFLEQGVLCLGPATRSGCNGRCTHANMPCRGCFGPNIDAIEQGCEMSNAMAPMLPIGLLIQKEDLAGCFYRYSLPSSIIPKIIKKHNETVEEKKNRISSTVDDSNSSLKRGEN